MLFRSPLERDREAAPEGAAGDPGGDPWLSEPSVKRPSRDHRPGQRLLEKTQQHRAGLLLDGEQLAEFILRLLELGLLLLGGSAVGGQLGLDVIGRCTRIEGGLECLRIRVGLTEPAAPLPTAGATLAEIGRAHV